MKPGPEAWKARLRRPDAREVQDMKGLGGVAETAAMELSGG